MLQTYGHNPIRQIIRNLRTKHGWITIRIPFKDDWYEE